jgi:hypothetical protein
MGAVSFLGSQAAESGAVSVSRPALPSSGASNAKGAYTQLIAATAYPAAWILVSMPRTGAGDYLMDIAVGGAGSEQVVLPNLPLSIQAANVGGTSTYLFPLHVPAGSRIAARGQNSTAGAVAVDTQVTLFAPLAGGEKGLERVEACGAVTATSLGTSVDPGGTANTKGSWVELIAATTIPYRWACLSIGHTNALGASTSWAVDVGIGAGGSEVVVVPNLLVSGGSTADAIPAMGLCFPLHVPAGTRVAVRAACTVNTATERLIEAVLHGAG